MQLMELYIYYLQIISVSRAIGTTRTIPVILTRSSLLIIFLLKRLTPLILIFMTFIFLKHICFLQKPLFYDRSER